ncbi:MAG: hypothetical protein QME87_07890 [Bacillota bacterium]|nr:hypothetical protein [Bacillota bacterium]
MHLAQTGPEMARLRAAELARQRTAAGLTGPRKFVPGVLLGVLRSILTTTVLEAGRREE